MNVKISYQTLLLPPPHSFAYTLNLDFEENALHIEYNLEFLNRDEVSADEIEAEGYSDNDDYHWKGSLGKVWVEDLFDDLLQAELNDENEDLNVYMHMEITHNGTTDEGEVAMAEEWDFRLQELIQAIYEKAQLENPLRLKFINIEDGVKSDFELKASFEHKRAEVNNKSISWDELHELMEEVYNIDYEGKSTSHPEKFGLWVDPDGTSGYYNFDELTEKSHVSKVKKRILEILD